MKAKHYESHPMATPVPGRSFAWLGLVLICLGAAAIPLDLLIARNFNSQTAGKLHELLLVGEAFGGGAGALVIACLLWAVAPQDRRRIPRLLVAAWGAGLTANLIK